MADTALLTRAFTRFVRDRPIDQLDREHAYKMVDWLPGRGASLRSRGQFDLAASFPNPGPEEEPGALVWAPFQNDPHLVVATTTGRVYRSAFFAGQLAEFIAQIGGTYSEDDIVTFLSRFWIATEDNPQEAPGVDPDWLLIPRWEESDYTEGDYVNHEGFVYVAATDGPEEEPGAGSEWTLVGPFLGAYTTYWELGDSTYGVLGSTTRLVD